MKEVLIRALPALLIFALLAAGGAALHWWGRHALTSAQAQARQLQQQRHGTAAELARLQKELPQIRQDIADFEIASLQGWWKAEDRLRFSDGLARLAQGLRLQKMEYGVAPREAYTGSANAPGGAWLRSPLEMQLGIEHEGQLLSFMENFSQLLGGIPVIHECELNRSAAGSDGNLLAQCKGALYSYVPAAANVITKPATR